MQIQSTEVIEIQQLSESPRKILQTTQTTIPQPQKTSFRKYWTIPFTIIVLLGIVNVYILIIAKPSNSTVNDTPKGDIMGVQSNKFTSNSSQLLIVQSNLLSIIQQIPTINQSQSNQPKKEQLKPLNLEPFYIWIESELPDRHMKKLNDLKFVYNFRLIRNCDMLLADMQELLQQKFNKMIYETPKMKAEVCRYIYLYYYGGLYLDLETTIDIGCLNNYLKDKRIFLEASLDDRTDLFGIYSSRSQDSEWLKTIRYYNTLNSFLKYNSYQTTSLRMIPDEFKTVAVSGCVSRTADGSERPNN